MAIVRCHDNGIDAARAALRCGRVDRSGNDAGHRIDRQARRQTRGGIAKRVAIDIAERGSRIDRQRCAIDRRDVSASDVATGASLLPVTVIVTSAVDSPPLPSDTV